MITFAREPFKDVQPEYGVFVYDYWHSSPENAGLGKLDFDWDTYHRLDHVGLLHLTVGREDDKMIAAALYLITPNLKRRKEIIAHCDTFAVSRDYRGQGIGKQLFEAVEPQLTELGVNEIHNLYREVYHTQPLFDKLGFELYERIYMKKVN